MTVRGKKYYRIGEVSELIGVEPHVLRYWEGEFKQIRTHRVAGQRLYKVEDIDLIRRIKNLLYEEGFTIAGARRQIAMEQKMGCSRDKTHKLLKEIRDELNVIKDMIGSNKNLSK
jgi:DNA-binding transcriptional MerR regulator